MYSKHLTVLSDKHKVALSVTWYLDNSEQQNNCLHEIESEKKYTAE